MQFCPLNFGVRLSGNFVGFWAPSTPTPKQEQTTAHHSQRHSPKLPVSLCGLFHTNLSRLCFIHPVGVIYPESANNVITHRSSTSNSQEQKFLWPIALCARK